MLSSSSGLFPEGCKVEMILTFFSVGAREAKATLFVCVSLTERREQQKETDREILLGKNTRTTGEFMSLLWVESRRGVRQSKFATSRPPEGCQPASSSTLLAWGR